MLLFTTAPGLVTARRLNDPYYLAPFGAAFTGIAPKQWGKASVVAGACAVLTSVAFVHELLRLREGAVESTGGA